MCRHPEREFSVTSCQSFETSLTQWYDALPPELNVEAIQKWSVDNVWALILKATSRRLECIYYRTLRQRFKATTEEPRRVQALQNQQNAMFELDTIINRLMLHQLTRYCHSFM